ncbi:MAG: 3-dehydro-L-gulonate 2-dehydrogenase [Candidatus Latescibacteria bacterium]|nr:3-dehydro-L-gulonate 2-dehydrogenase [Candidatus Latescibacterota bacterium]
MRVSFETMFNEFKRVLINIGFSNNKARLCARLFSESSLDGVYSHGVNRFPLFIDYIKKGIIKIHNDPVRIQKLGIFERWDGQLGPGNLNAYSSMSRAIEIANTNGMGCVALRNTNHWMRGGTYGWQAADANCIALCFTNTMPNMPPWGALDKKVGNNPLVLAIPRAEGHIVLDMAMSQFSYGKLNIYLRNNEQLPLPGGYDTDGNLTCDPSQIKETGRFLPAGYWKGSGLAIILDLFASILSDGNATHMVDHSGDEYGLSQIFMAWNPAKLKSENLKQTFVTEVVNFIRNAEPATQGEKVYYPGERTLKTREHNRQHGIPVEKEIWDKIITM